MNILLLGAGGREHSLAWKIAQSPLLDALYCAPGNPGMAACGTNVDMNPEDIPAILTFTEENDIDLVVVGPEAPLALGVADALREASVPVFGPGQAAARLETSKAFTKALCAANGIPTAAYFRCTTYSEAEKRLDEMTPPYVIKADGLAAGKGVIITDNLQEARQETKAMFDGRFGAAGAEVVLEEFMEGEEASFFALCDGTRILPLIGSQDHKRVGEGDTGPNTGGMGAYSPAPVFSADVEIRTLDEIILPTVYALSEMGTPFQGVLYAGLMVTAEGPKLIEYNARFGDPECQVMMRRMQSDIVPLLMAAALGDLSGESVAWTADAAVNVVLAAKGYPGAYDKGEAIKGLETAAALPGVEIFHAGTAERDGGVVSNGGRVLNVTATGKDVAEATARAYAGVDAIDWPGGFCRRDIAWRVLQTS